MTTYIKTAKDARAAIGKQVAWNDLYWVRLNGGVLQNVYGKNLLINGDWKWRPHLRNLHVAENQSASEVQA